MSDSKFCRFIGFLVFTLILVSGLPARAAGVFVPAAARMDMVYDQERKVLYITSGSAVLRYHLGSGTFLSTYELNGKPAGIDISPDGNILAVADQSLPGIHLIDLNSNTVTQALYTPQPYEGGSYSVAYGADGAILISSTFDGSGWVPLRRYDPAKPSMTQVATVRQNTMLSASADRLVIGYAESNISSGPVGIYDVTKQGGTYTQGTSRYNYEIGSSRHGTQFAVPTYGGTYIYDGLLNRIITLGTYAAQQPIGVVYDPLKDILYSAWAGTREIRAIDTTSFATVATYDAEYTFTHTGNWAYTQGRLRIAKDGSLLFATVEGGIRYFTLSEKPVANPQSVTLDEDTSVGVLLTGSSGGSAPLTFSIAVPPQHGTLVGDAPHVFYVPAPDYAGPDQFQFTVNNGTETSDQAVVDLLVRPVNDPPRALNDVATASKGAAVTIPVLSNDADVDGDTLTVAYVGSGQTGKTTTDGKTVTYTPSRNFSGSDYFSYVISDGKGGTATATVTVSVPRKK